ncbi:uncharacterized protein LOC105194148 isoform X1 [Solenopsis invicta]|uniref:uncharacterized protein LOC105194148 isoform X1 n=1 Tax=Solenopsis invicta TaxID=13686 RepID=UPI00193D194D|nr:uncharacterized protein LOC105194148 isoform X1 [Solenopsis invicta]
MFVTFYYKAVQPRRLAVLDIKNGKSLRETARKFNIPRTTLLRHKRANDNIAGTETPSVSTSTEAAPPLTTSDIQIRGKGRLTVFDKEQEKFLEEYLLHCSNIFLSMTSKEARLLAYQFASKVHIEMPENWKKDQLAGLEWFRGFMGRHPNFSLRTPEA